MSASASALGQVIRQARSLEQVIDDQDQRLCEVQVQIGTLVSNDTFDGASARALSTDQVELAISALESDIMTKLASYLKPRDLHTRLARCCRYVDMLACADRVRNLAKAFGIRQATPFLDSLPTLEEWLLSQRSAGVSEDDLRLRIADYQHRIQLLQRRFKAVPGLYQLLGPRFREAAAIREKLQTATTSITAVRNRLTQLVDTKNSVTSTLEPLLASTVESQRLARQIPERIASVRQRLQQNSDKQKYYDMLKSDLDKATRTFDRFQEVFQQWETARAESTASASGKLQQLTGFSEELARAKENLKKIMTVGPSLSDMESNREARLMVKDTALLESTLNEVKEANANWRLQKNGAAGELYQEIDRLRIAHAKLIDTAERYAESYRAVRSKVLYNWEHDAALNPIEK